MSYLTDYYAQTPSPSQAFGAPRDGGKRHHTGADFSHSTRPGTIDVPIIEAGTVTGNYWTEGYGWRLVVGPWSFSHLEERSPLKVGDPVKPGDIAGKEGDSGWTSGSCCHVEYVSGGRRVDPVPVIRRILGATPAGGGAIPFPTPKPDTKKGSSDMDYLLQIDPTTDGNWYVANYSRGTLYRVANGLQLDLIKRDPNVYKVAGPQPATAVAGMRRIDK